MTPNPRRRVMTPEPPPEEPSIWKAISARRVGLGAVGVVLAAVGLAAFVWPRVAERVGGATTWCSSPKRSNSVDRRRG